MCNETVGTEGAGTGGEVDCQLTTYWWLKQRLQCLLNAAAGSTHEQAAAGDHNRDGERRGNEIDDGRMKGGRQLLADCAWQAELQGPGERMWPSAVAFDRAGGRGLTECGAI